MCWHWEQSTGFKWLSALVVYSVVRIYFPLEDCGSISRSVRWAPPHRPPRADRCCLYHMVSLPLLSLSLVCSLSLSSSLTLSCSSLLCFHSPHLLALCQSSTNIPYHALLTPPFYGVHIIHFPLCFWLICVHFLHESLTDLTHQHTNTHAHTCRHSCISTGWHGNWY